MFELVTSGLGRALLQGVSTRNRAPEPRGKPSGLPWDANFIDIAPLAGLREINTFENQPRAGKAVIRRYESFHLLTHTSLLGF
jgi:hypothetical protein